MPSEWSVALSNLLPGEAQCFRLCAHCNRPFPVPSSAGAASVKEYCTKSCQRRALYRRKQEEKKP